METKEVMKKIIKSEILKSKIFKWLLMVTIAAMAISGFGQMPIFKRYYIADIPGLAWTANYYITHNIHYISAVILIALSAYILTVYFLILKNNLHITWQGFLIIISFSGIILSGILKVISNQKGIYFGKPTLISLDLIHTILTFLLLILSGVFSFLKFRLFEKKEM